MTATGPVALLLTSPLAPPAGREGLLRALAARGPTTAPTWALEPRAADLLAAPADSVLAETVLAGTGEAGAVVVCGVGAGAVLALRVAALAPQRVAGLVLATGRTPSGAVLVRSVHRAVADLLPLATLQRLHASERLLLQALDRVRVQDVRTDAARVGCPARVAWGRRDPLDRLAADRLAAALPTGALVTVDAGPGWVWREPDRLARLVAAGAEGS